MRAVNLIPTEQRSGASVGAGRSEGAAYAVLAVLVGVALLAFLYGKANRDVSSRRGEAATLTARAQKAQAQAATLAPYTSFAQLREQRAQAVATLVDSRFDWAHTFHEFGRVLTGQTSLTSLEGTIAAVAATVTPVAPAAAAPAGSSSSAASSSSSSTPAASSSTTASSSSSTSATTTPAAATAAATPSVTSTTPPGSVPTFTLAGCATSQPAVAEMLQRLRLIDGVNEVVLQSSTAASGSSASASCGHGPAFTVTVIFDALPTAEASATAAGVKAAPVSNKTSAPSATTATGGEG